MSRDAYTLMKRDHALIGYVARQSLISAMSPATELLGGEDLESSFQNRMLNGDISSNLVPTLQEAKDATDLILMDLTDERLGVHKLPDKSFVTHSSELVKAGRLRQLSPPPGVIKTGTERHWGFWSRAAEKFAIHLDILGLKEKVLVVNTPWAETSFEGVEVPTFRDYSTATMNEHLAQMADRLRSLGIRVVDMPASLAVSTDKHKWGIDPFHYGQPAYLWIQEQVTAAFK